MSRLLTILMLIAAAGFALFAGCSASSTTARQASVVRIDGSSTVYPISAMIMELYREQNPDARVLVAYSGTGGGMDKFINSEIQICDASRAMKQSEADRCKEAGIEFIELEVAYDGLAVVVSPENDWVDCVTVEQLKKIWEPGAADKVTKWSDVDPSWPAENMSLYGPGTDSGTFDYFTKVINKEEKASRADYQRSEDDNVLVRGVSSDKFALGYFGYAYYEENKDKLKLLGVDGGEGCVKPTMETVAQNTYKPLSRPLFIYVRKDALSNPSMADFVQFYIENAAEAAKEVGYVPVQDQIYGDNKQKLAEALK